jgi:CBS domain-containing protein
MTERTVFQSMAQRHVVSVLPTATVYMAACVMTRANSSSLLVIDSANTMQGIVTERDLMARVLAKALDPSITTVADIMTRSPQCVTPETKVADAVLIMIERGFRHLAVVTADTNKILGVFSVRDALPREVNAAVSLAEFNEQVNDALG